MSNLSFAGLRGYCLVVVSSMFGLVCGLANAAPGDRLGEPILVVQNGNGSFATFPTIARNGAGSFAIVWYSETRNPDGSSQPPMLIARLYTAQGQSVGSPFRVDQKPAFPAIATMPNAIAAGMDDAGNLVVLWQEFGSTIYSPSVIHGRQFDAAGTARGPEFVLPLSTAGNQLAPDVAVAANGDFVAVWAESNPTQLPAGQFVISVAESSRIRSQRFGADGSRRGLPKLIDSALLLGDGNSDQGGNSSVGFPAVAVGSDGQFAITWTRSVQYAGSIIAARFAANGEALGSSFTVSPAGNYPDIGIDASGRILIAWDSAFRRYQADGRPASAEVSRASFLPKLGVAPLGAFVLASVGREPQSVLPFAPPVELVQFFDADDQALTAQMAAAPSLAAFGGGIFHGVGVDAAGNYAVVLEGQAGTPANPGPSGIYVQRFSGR